MERSKFIDGQILDAVKQVEAGFGGANTIKKPIKPK